MKKNKIIIKIISVFIAFVMLTVSFYSCSSKGKTLMSIEKTDISVNMYQFWLSRYKADYIKNYLGGVNDSSAWDKIYDINSNETYNDILTKNIIEDAKMMLAALYMFDEKGLKLPDDAIKEVDELMADILTEAGEGSKNILNAELANFGVNYKILREIYLNEKKIAYLQLYLYGKDASEISAAAKESFYQENYLHFKHIYLFSNVKPVYETDAHGQDIYYLESGRIAYDEKNGKSEFIDGVVIRDDKGDIVYYREDGKISYDIKNGKRAYVYGDDGYPKTAECTIGEINERKLLAAELLQRVEDGENFERLIQDYNEDVAVEEYPNGFYHAKNSPYYFAEILEALQEMQIGEVKIVNSAYGIHILKKYELEQGGYDDSKNIDFFKDFNSKITIVAFTNKAKEYYDKIVIDEELLKLYTLKNVTPCYNY